MFWRSAIFGVNVFEVRPNVWGSKFFMFQNFCGVKIMREAKMFRVLNFGLVKKCWWVKFSEEIKNVGVKIVVG